VPPEDLAKRYWRLAECSDKAVPASLEWLPDLPRRFVTEVRRLAESLSCFKAVAKPGPEDLVF
jgi:hypothetical protein